MRVIFRVDSSQMIGSGHLMRCLTLAARMKSYEMEISFVCRDLPGNMACLVQEQGYNLHMLPQSEYDDSLSGYLSWLTVSQEQDAQDTIDCISSYDKVDLVVVDSYAIDNIWERLIRAYTNKIFVIDDLANRTHECDYLLDQTYGADKSNRYELLVQKDTQQFLGVSYALLRSAFYSLREKCTVRKCVKKIFVFFGGSDDTEETEKVMQALCREDFSQYYFFVIVGAMNFAQKRIEAYCEQLPNVEYHCQVDNIEYYIAQSDIAIAAAGGNTWERCMLGLPSVMTVTAENQMEIANQLNKTGAALSLGWHDNISSDDYVGILKRVEALPIQLMSQRAFAVMGNSKIDDMIKAIEV